MVLVTVEDYRRDGSRATWRRGWKRRYWWR